MNLLFQFFKIEKVGSSYQAKKPKFSSALYIRYSKQLDTQAHDVFLAYEIVARLLEILAVVSSAILVIAILPKLDILTSEVTSIIEMIFIALQCENSRSLGTA